MSDVEVAAAVAIDLAESGGWSLLLDDLHLADMTVAEPLLMLLARYSRKSRWLFTSRSVPQLTELAAQHLRLAGLPDEVLLSLARILGSELREDELRQVALRSGGSPWVLQQRLATLGEDMLSDERLLGGLSEEALTFLETLSTIDTPLPLNTLATLVKLPVQELPVQGLPVQGLPVQGLPVQGLPVQELPVQELPIQELLQPLERRGLIQRTYAGYRLHDMVRRLLLSSPATARGVPGPTLAAHPLTEQSDPELVLEGIRLLLHGGETAAVLQVLEKWGTLFLDRGFAPRVWQLLELSTAAELRTWRLRCAVRLDMPVVVAPLPAPSEPSFEEQLLWGCLCVVRGEVREGERLARAPLAQHPGLLPPEVRFEAGILLVKSLSEQQRRGEALAVLETLWAPSPTAEVVRDSYGLILHSYLHHEAEVLARMKPLLLRAETLEPRAREQVQVNLARVMAEFSVTEARQLVLQVLGSSLPRAWYLLVLIIACLDSGRLEEAAEAISRYERFAASQPIRRPLSEVFRSWLELFRGELVQLSQALPERRHRVQDLNRVDLSLSFLLIRSELERAQGLPPGPVPELPGEGTPLQLLVQLSLLQTGIRHGRTLSAEDEALLARAQDSIRTRRFAQLIQAELATLNGALDTALGLTEQLMQSYEAGGFALNWVEVGLLRCLLLLLLGQHEALAALAHGLLEKLPPQETPRYEGEVSFFLALNGHAAPEWARPDWARPEWARPEWARPDWARPEWARLEWLAQRLNVSPMAARRARVLLGGSARLDGLDQLLLRALSGWKKPETVLGHAPSRMEPETEAGQAPAQAELEMWQAELEMWHVGWGLDKSRLAVWLPDGRWLSFQTRRQLWKLLMTLLTHGGRASKEQLVEALWPGECYHPLQHDGRLHNAVRKLRMLIEVQPSEPTRLLTTEQGYALGGLLRVGE